MNKQKHWYNYVWLWAIVYFSLSFFNIVFAWAGMIDFLVPLGIAIFGGSKYFCNRLCARGQLFLLLGNGYKLSRNLPTPAWMYSTWFRYGFLAFFMAMFGNIILQTYLVAGGAADLQQILTLFWTIQLPWSWAYSIHSVPDWVAQYSFGFYSLMSTSLLLGLICMALYKPRTWCTFCPMGTMTQGICKIKQKP